MSDSKIVRHADGTVVMVGYDATKLFQAAAIRSALGALASGLTPTRGYTMKRGLEAASAITGKKYVSTGRSRRIMLACAREDLRVWIETMKAALPVEIKQ